MELVNQHIFDCLKNNLTFAVATILINSGSTPRSSGSRMVVLKDRTINGTVGGGLVEALVIDACIEQIDKNRCIIKHFTLNQDLKGGLDMVCGGALSVLIETFMPDPGKNRDTYSNLTTLFKALVDIEKKGKKGFLVSKIDGFSKTEFSTQKCLVMPNGDITGKNMLPKPLFDALLDNTFSGQTPVIHNHHLEEFIIEPVMPKECIYIFGAGHVGFQLARIAHITDFQTVIIDDREEFANRDRFPHARHVHALESFNKAFDCIEVDSNSYIVIVTRGHLHDQTVLEGALETNPAYIGMIGSRNKRDKIYKNLLKNGVGKDTLDKIYSPIGIKIKAQTPGEIAVSIIGEIIKKRYSR